MRESGSVCVLLCIFYLKIVVSVNCVTCTTTRTIVGTSTVRNLGNLWGHIAFTGKIRGLHFHFARVGFTVASCQASQWLALN